jgi:hypothetical protein
VDNEQKNHTSFYEGVVFKQVLNYHKTKLNSKLHYDVSVINNYFPWHYSCIHEYPSQHYVWIFDFCLSSEDVLILKPRCQFARILCR